MSRTSRLVIHCLSAVVLAAGAQQAAADPTVFFGEDLGAGSAAAMPLSFAARDAFLGALTGSYGSQSFESFAGGATFPAAGALSFAGSSVTASLTGGLIRDVPFNARFAVSGTNYLESSFNQRIDFSTPIAAFGVFVVDANEFNNSPQTATIGGQLLTPEQILARPFDSIDGIFRIVTQRADGSFQTLFDGGTFPALDSSALFAGIVDYANPFTNIIFINGTSGLDGAFQDGFGYDDLLVSAAVVRAVPEPETYALMLMGLAAIGAAARRRKARAAR